MTQQQAPTRHLLIEVNDIGYAYPGREKAPALSGVSIALARGERVVLLGPNGAGKSTLLQLMAGLCPPTQGEVRWEGHALTERPEPLEAGIGYLFQEPEDQLILPLVGEDVALGPRNLGLPEEEVKLRTLEALTGVGLSGFEGRLSHSLSFGEKQRAALAGVLACRPRVLLLDEPTSALDPGGRRGLVALLREQSRETSMVISTHDVNVAYVLAQRVIVLDGEVLADGPAKSILRDRELLEGANLEVPFAMRLEDQKEI